LSDFTGLLKHGGASGPQGTISQAAASFQRAVANSSCSHLEDMALLKFLSSARGALSEKKDRDPAVSTGPETLPVPMNLEERMAFRRELLFEAIRGTLHDESLEPGSYHFKVMHTDKRGHCFVVMLDMTQVFMDSARGSPHELSAIAARLAKSAQTRYGLVIDSVYWRTDESLGTLSAARGRRSSLPEGPASAAEAAARIKKSQGTLVAQLAEFEAAWQKRADAKVGERTYTTDFGGLEEIPKTGDS
jgi:hypothetical protein